MTAKSRRILPAADADIDSQILFFKKRDESLAVRYFKAVQRAIDALVEMPSMGSPVRVPSIKDRNLRKWPVTGFPNALIFYRELSDSVEIVRVLNASQNWWLLLGDF